MFEITVFANAGGRPLSKTIALRDGQPASDASACRMARGTASRAGFYNLSDFAAFITRMPNHQAIALGVPKHGMPDGAAIGTKDVPGGTIAGGWPSSPVFRRTKENFAYRPGLPALALIDVDGKGMPPDLRKRIDKAGGVWPVLTKAMPELAGTGHVIRASTSAGLRLRGKPVATSYGWHIFVLLADGTSAERFLKDLHRRCWLAGLGWVAIGEAGTMFDRSPVDCSVFGGERLCFEGTAIVTPPLTQEARVAIATNGPPLKRWKPLTAVEEASFTRLVGAAKERTRAAGEAQRAKWAARTAADLKKRGYTAKEARRITEQQSGGVLLPGVVLTFDRADLAGATVLDVLDDPEKFAWMKLADPIEGPAYGRTTAMVMLTDVGTPRIKSFAHGGMEYTLAYDAQSIEAAIRKNPRNAFAAFTLRRWIACVTDAEDKALRRVVTELTGFAL